MKKMMNSKIISIIVLLFFSLSCIALNQKDSSKDILSLTYTGSSLVTDTGNLVITDNSSTIFGDATRLQGFTGQYDKGSYQLKIDYQTDSESTAVMLWSNKSTADGFNAGEAFSYFTLQSDKTSMIVDFELSKYVSDLTLFIDFSGGNLTVNQIIISSVGNYFNSTVILNVLIIIVTLVLGLILMQNKVQNWIKNNKVILLIGLFLIGFISLPLLMSSLHGAPYQDLVYHLNRIEGLSEAIKVGDFPFRIHPTELNSYGQAEGAFYPELFLLLPAFLRSLGLSVVYAYKVLIFGAIVATVPVAYISFKNIFKSKEAGIIGMILYNLSIYRLTAMYVRSAVGEYLAIIFIPLVLWGLIEVFYRNKNKWYLLTIGMTGLLQSHLITTELVGIGCVIFGLINLKKLCEKKAIIALGKAILFFVLINLWWLIPFIDFSSQGVGAFGRNYGIEEPIIRDLTKLFAIDYPLLAGSEMPFSIGFLLLIGLVVFIYLLFMKKIRRNSFEGKLGIACSIVGFITLWLSTDYFPWKQLNGIGLVNKFASSLQFSWRFLSISAVAFSIISIISIYYFVNKYKKHKNMIYSIVVGAFTIMCLKLVLGNMFLIPIYAPANYQADIDHPGYTLGGWYLPENTDDYYVYYRPITVASDSENYTLRNYSRKGSQISFDFEMINPGTLLELPLLYYDSYYATIDGENVELLKSDNNLVSVDIRERQKGSFQIEYKEKAIYLFSNIVSIGSFIILFIFIRKDRRKNEEIH